MILRKNKDLHLDNDCQETFIDCSNHECKEEIKRKNHSNHVNNECNYRLIECKFKMYGCDIGVVKACDMDKHLDDYKFDHLSKQFTFVTNQV